MAETKKFTFEVPADLRAMMDAHPEVNWTAVFRQAIRRQAAAAEIAARIVEEMDDPRVKAIAASVKKGSAERYRQAVKRRRAKAR